MHCPECGRDIGPDISPNGHNRSDSVSIDVPLSLLSSLESILAVGRNTEMMCSNQEAADALEDLRKTIVPLQVEFPDKFRRHQWSRVQMLVAAGEDWTIERVTGAKSWHKPHIVISSRDTAITLKDLDDIDAEFARLDSWLKRLAPLK